MRKKRERKNRKGDCTMACVERDVFPEQQKKKSRLTVLKKEPQEIRKDCEESGE